MMYLSAVLTIALLVIDMSKVLVSGEKRSIDISRRAIVIGATGATGREVVRVLLERDWIVTTVSRSELDLQHTAGEKIDNLKSVQSNFEDLDSLVDIWKGHDALFNCIGTTRGQAGSADAFIDVEVGITNKTVNVAKKAGILHVSVLSSQGANKDIYVPTTLIHPLLYIRTMGQKQQAVIDGAFPSTTVFQPGILDRLVGDRMAENMITWLMPSATLRVDVLALAMVQDAERKLEALRTIDIAIGEERNCGTDSMGSVTYLTGNAAIAASISR